MTPLADEQLGRGSKGLRRNRGASPLQTPASTAARHGTASARARSTAVRLLWRQLTVLDSRDFC